MFHPQGPTVWELLVQGLSSTEQGYDLLAPKFDSTPFRTPEAILGPAMAQLGGPASIATALDMCCGTGAALSHLRPLCRDRVVGIDLSQGDACGRAPEDAGGPWGCPHRSPAWACAGDAVSRGLRSGRLLWRLRPYPAPGAGPVRRPSRAGAQAWGPVRVCHNSTATVVVGAVLARQGVQCPHARAEWAPDTPFYYVLSDLSLTGSRHAAAPARLCRDRVRGYVSRPLSIGAARDRDLDRPGAGVTHLARHAPPAARRSSRTGSGAPTPTVPPVSTAPDVQAIIQQAAQQALPLSRPPTESSPLPLARHLIRHRLLARTAGAHATMWR